MDPNKRKAIEAAGWKVGDAADFLELSEDERKLFDSRLELAIAVRCENGRDGVPIRARSRNDENDHRNLR